MLHFHFLMSPANLLKLPVKIVSTHTFKSREINLELIINLLLAKKPLYKQHIYWKCIPKSPVLNCNTFLYNCTLWIISLSLKSLHTVAPRLCAGTAHEAAPSYGAGISSKVLPWWGTGTAEGTTASQIQLHRQTELSSAWLGKPKSSSEKRGSYNFSGKLLLNYEKQNKLPAHEQPGREREKLPAKSTLMN